MINKIICPHCGAQINMDLKGMSSYYCPYCGQQSSVDDGNRTFTYNYNINQRYANDAALEEIRRIERKDKREHRSAVVLLLFIVGIWVIILVGIPLGVWLNEKKNIDSGMIKVEQSSKDMEGQNYKAVMEQLRSTGFNNIIAMDLDDDSWILQNNDKVVKVSIGGDTSFSADSFFFPDEEIIISYH